MHELYRVDIASIIAMDRHVRASNTVELAKAGKSVIDGEFGRSSASFIVNVIVDLVQVYY